MKRLIAALALGALAQAPLHAADIYQWVDDEGQVHLSDSVPERFRKSATRIDSHQFELTPQQRKEAAARAARERARAEQSAQRAAKASEAQAAEAAEAAAAASAAQAKAPAKPVDTGNDCATLRRRFQASADCYGPFHNVNGSVKPEAFEVCGPPVPAPALECSSTPAH